MYRRSTVYTTTYNWTLLSSPFIQEKKKKRSSTAKYSATKKKIMGTETWECRFFLRCHLLIVRWWWWRCPVSTVASCGAATYEPAGNPCWHALPRCQHAIRGDLAHCRVVNTPFVAPSPSVPPQTYRTRSPRWKCCRWLSWKGRWRASIQVL
jgi:hypothetical protein